MSWITAAFQGAPGGPHQAVQRATASPSGWGLCLDPHLGILPDWPAPGFSLLISNLIPRNGIRSCEAKSVWGPDIWTIFLDYGTGVGHMYQYLYYILKQPVTPSKNKKKKPLILPIPKPSPKPRCAPISCPGYICVLLAVFFADLSPSPLLTCLSFSLGTGVPFMLLTPR